MTTAPRAAYILRSSLQARLSQQSGVVNARSSLIVPPPRAGRLSSPRLTTAQLSPAARPRSFSTAASNVPPTAAPGSGPGSKQSRRSLVLLSTALISTGLVAGIAIALVAPRPQIVSLIFPVPTPHPHPAHSEEGKLHTKDIERGLHQLELVKRLKQETVPLASLSQSDAEGTATSGSALTAEAGKGLAPTSDAATPLAKKYTVSRPYAATVPGPHSLSSYTLRGPGKFAVPPLVFTTADKKESILVLHVGSGLCGHEGVVHGGLLATVLDEALGRTALLNLPTNIGVTATLNLKYKKPTFANQYLIIKTELKEQKGRKAFVRGRVENVDGETLVEAEALFVEPRMAQFLSNSSVREALK